MIRLIREHSDTLHEAKRKKIAQSFIFFEKNTNLFCWVECMFSDLLPFSFWARLMIQVFTHLTLIPTAILLQAMNDLSLKVMKYIKNWLPIFFTLLFDEWSSGGNHWLSISAVWSESEILLEYSRFLNSFAPLGNKQNLSSQFGKEALYIILKFYRKNDSYFAGHIYDNFATNQTVTCFAKVKSVGCVSHLLVSALKTVSICTQRWRAKFTLLW